jgi:Domain of unknown function DUF11
MSDRQQRRHLPTCMIVLAMAILLVFAAGAQADPGTVTDEYTGLSLTVSDTTPAPGDTITISESYVVGADDVPAIGATMGFGDNLREDEPAVNLADLSMVPASCTEDFSSCAYSSVSQQAFTATVPVGDEDDTVAGTAQFTVSAGATDGETISFSGFHESRLDEFLRRRADTPVMELTVTAPKADLGVSLSAAAAGLLTSHVNYDVAVTNNGPAAASSATISTQLATQATSIASSTCTFSSSTHKVSCPIGALADGATTHATFTAYFGLLTIGLPLNATATRTTSSPVDPNAANDSDSANCTALTALLITC